MEHLPVYVHEQIAVSFVELLQHLGPQITQISADYFKVDFSRLMILERNLCKSAKSVDDCLAQSVSMKPLVILAATLVGLL